MIALGWDCNRPFAVLIHRLTSTYGVSPWPVKNESREEGGENIEADITVLEHIRDLI